ncbi:hypothetical protein [Leifsonia xyli]|uniref:hypothetical protein n=1 Tax=Leifsonia xyli TaxID=1575 RepID=UPI003D6788A3
MGRRRWIGLAVSAAALGAAVLAVVLVGQAQSAGLIAPASVCFPAQLEAAPAVAHPGQDVTLSSGAADCDLGYDPGHTYAVTLQHRETRTAPMRVVVATDGSFRVTVAVPATFPRGQAVVIVTGSPYDECDDTPSASCVGYSIPLAVD